MLIDTVLRLFDAAVSAADPRRAVRTYLPGNVPQPDEGGRLVVLALGKAARSMMDEALRHLPADPERECLVVTNAENAKPLSGCEVLIGGHPVPDQGSLAAGDRMLEMVQSLTENDRVLALISGGGSALAVAPAAPLSLADKQAVNELLLSSGLDINAMNEVRQCLSTLKGGGLARAAAPAQVTALILSDVIGDDLAAVASGPTVAPIGTRASARARLEAHGLLAHCDPVVQDLLAKPGVSPDKIKSENILIGSNLQSVTSAAQAMPGITQLPKPIEGDVAAAAEYLLSQAQTNFVAGGETTVVVTGSGLGGRNQELALRFALLAENRLEGDWIFLSGGTDGRDGPTDAAGGIVGPGTAQLIRASGRDPQGLLDDNDAYHALDRVGALLRIPPTGTNVADIQIFLKG